MRFGRIGVQDSQAVPEVRFDTPTFNAVPWDNEDLKTLIAPPFTENHIATKQIAVASFCGRLDALLGQ